MGRLIFTLLFCITVCSKYCYAQYADINFDTKTLAAFATQSAVRLEAENLRNDIAKEIRQKKDSIALYATTMSTLKLVHQQALKNVNDFKEESSFYKNIASTANEIIKEMPNTYSYFLNSDIAQKVNLSLALNNIKTECISLVEVFSNIATNGNVSNPLSSQSIVKKKDGMNVMDRDQRLSIVSDVLNRLDKIKSAVQNIQFIGKYSSYKTTTSQFDPKGWAIIMDGKQNVQNTISLWDRHSKK